MTSANPCQVNEVAHAEGRHLLQSFSKGVHNYLSFQKPWVFSLRVPLLPQLAFGLWEEIRILKKKLSVTIGGNWIITSIAQLP